MNPTLTAYSYKGTRRNQLTFKPHCSAGGVPGITVEGPGAAIWLDLASVEPFVQDIRDAAASTRRNAAVTRRPRNSKRAA